MSRTARKARPGATLLMLVWLALLVPVLFLAATPTATIVQGLLALTVLAILFALKPFVQKSLRVRFFVLAAASTLVLRYWFWRLTETLPSPDDPVSFIAALVLFGAESFTVVLFFLTALITADPTTPPLPKRMRRSEAPTVDVLVPSYNEPPELLAVTLAAAMQMVYPEGRKTVVLCDDGGTDQKCASPDPKAAKEAQERRAQLQAMCEQMGVVYTTRARNEHAKAGNLNSALHKLRGELVLILDADHVPSREFLARTAGYFVENPKLFLVQTPHFFTNRDPIERNIGLPETCPSENEMFYTEIHRGLDRLGGAFFCGSAALIRRKALDDVGGISGRTITEDAETALDIHSRGWESLYLDHAMIAGLQPETFASFITQRGRWATGMMQMLILKNPLFRPGLTMLQRVCYLNSMSYWLFPLVRMIFLLSPLFYLFFGLEVFVVTYDEVLAYILPHLLVGFRYAVPGPQAGPARSRAKAGKLQLPAGRTRKAGHMVVKGPRKRPEPKPRRRACCLRAGRTIDAGQAESLLAWCAPVVGARLLSPRCGGAVPAGAGPAPWRGKCHARTCCRAWSGTGPSRRQDAGQAAHPLPGSGAV